MPSLRGIGRAFGAATLVVVASAGVPNAASPAPAGGALTIQPYTFVSSRGDTVAAELGRLRVPERHGVVSSATAELAFVRFACTSPTPGPPIVYLAGGPGGSGIGAARSSRFPLFMAMRALGDVIALDQRGTGLSTPNLKCTQSYALPLDVAVTGALAGRLLADSARACVDEWRRKGVDVDAYNTNESADDLVSLADALGAPTLRLWSISYGTHLALAAIRRHPEHIARAILAGVEGPDHTLKLPGNTERLMDHMTALAAADSDVHAAVPDLKAALSAVLARVERVPARVRVPNPAERALGDSVDIVVSRDNLASLFANLLGSAETQPYFPAFVRAAASGDFVLLARLDLAFGGRAGGPVGSAMAIAMDCASGASAARRRQIAREAAATVLGDATNPLPDTVCHACRIRELNDAFRSPVHSDVPVLFISGTQDLNTPASNAAEVARGFRHATQLVIDGAAHSDPLFLSSPEILKRMLAFLANEPVSTEPIRAPFRFRMDLTDLERYLK